MSVLDPPPIYQLDESPSPPGVVSALTLLPQQPPEPSFELLLTLIQPSKRIRTANKKTKNLKPESESKGPFNISVNTEWDAFLGIIAEKISLEPSHLLVSSFEWHWLKPASGPWLPVQDENGFTSMLRKIKSKSELYIIVRMQVLVRSKALDAVNEHKSNFEDNTVSKKVHVYSMSQTYFTYFL